MEDTETKDTPFCPLPFMQLELKPSGQAAPCCWLPKFQTGNFGDGGWEGVWNGEKMRSLRREFLEGKVKTCARQIRHLGCHQFFPHLVDKVVRAEIQEKAPRRLDLRLNGRCNLECVMCEVWQEPNGVYDSTEFWSKGEREIFPHLLEVDVLGGEPFIQRDTYRLIDRISGANPHCTWGFVTNGAWQFTSGVERALDKIAIRYLQVSVDSLQAQVYAELRKRGNLAQTLSTVAHLIRYNEKRGRRRPLGLRISACVQQKNWAEIPEFIRLSSDLGIGLEFQYLYYPRSLSLNALPDLERRRVLTFLQNLAVACQSDVLNPILIPLQESLPEVRLKAGPPSP